MKTTLDIPEGVISAVQKLYNIHTKREAVIFALEEAAKRFKIERIIEKLGTFEDFMSQDDLQTMRLRDTSRDISLN